MKASLDSFIIELNNLQHHVETFKLESKLLGIVNPSDDLLQKYQEHVSLATGKRRFNYNSIVISMYSSLELFIRTLLKEYLNYLSKIVPQYSDLPSAIQENHIDLSSELINRTKRLSYLTTVTSEQIILNLASCLNNKANYRINTDAFTQHTANFRAEVIQDFFTRVGVTNISNYLLDNLIFTTCLQKIYPDADWSKSNIEKSLHDIAFSYLNNLVDRRNEVAHGNPNEVQILSNDILLEYVDFLKAYSVALYEVVYSFTLPYLAQYKGIKMGNPFKVLKNGYVLGIEVTDISIKIGDLVVAKPATNEQLWIAGEIRKLEVNNVDRREVMPGEKVGIQVPFKAKENQIIYIVTKE